MEVIQHIELGSAATNITFSSIPQTYTDLLVVFSGRTTSTGTGPSLEMHFNNDTSNYSLRVLQGAGSGTPVSYTDTLSRIAIVNANNTTSNTFSSTSVYIPNYTSSANKSFSVDTVSEDNATTAWQMTVAGLWSNSSAISSIRLRQTGGVFELVAGSSATLYGIKNTTPQAKAVGGVVSIANGYAYHVFGSSGTFTPLTSITADVLIVAGGGGGQVGGGGAGGYRLLTNQSISTAQTVTIGAGGAGGVSGSNSSFGSLSSTGGGFGGQGASGGRVGANGGSGGGAGWQSGAAPGSGNAGSYSPSEGNNGGNWQGGGFPDSSGGGGGAGGTGGAGSGGRGGAGGAGSNSASSWATDTRTGVSGFYAGGGAGAGQSTGSQSTGGSGGGGNGQNGGGDAPTTGVANTGGGGGGGWNNAGVAGGSGIVIVRYAV